MEWTQTSSETVTSTGHSVLSCLFHLVLFRPQIQITVMEKVQMGKEMSWSMVDHTS